MTPRARSLYALRQRIRAGASPSELIAALDALITLDGPPDFDALLAVALDRGADRGIYPEPLQRAIAHALPRLWIATGWIRLEEERRYERRNAATGEPTAWVYPAIRSEWADRHEGEGGTWTYRAIRRLTGGTIEGGVSSRRAAWVHADELLLEDDFGGQRWALAPSACPVCRGSGELVYGEDSERCGHCRGTGEIVGGEG